MSQRDHDHDLMESVTADQAPSVPASPPPRDSMEDADPSLTRKRPRLDNGEALAMPADSASTNDPIAHPSEQQVEMTIRSQPPASSHTMDGAGSTNDASTSAAIPNDEIQETESDATIAGPEDGAADAEDASADSPPVIALDDDEDDDEEIDTGETMAGHEAPSALHFEYDAETYFQQFPFAQHGNYMQAVHNIAQHFQGNQAVDGTVLPQLAVWLDQFPNRPSQWKSFFLDRATFWEEFYGMVNRVLLRRSPFGEQFCDDGQSEDDILATFLEAYLRICACLLQVDAEMLSRWTSEETYTYPVVSQKHIRHLYTILRSERFPVFHLLSKEYAADTQSIGVRLTQTFLNADGLKHLFRFADQACGKVTAGLQNWLATFLTQLLNALGWSFFDIPERDDRSQYNQNVLHFFRRYNVDLQSPSKVVDTGVTKELIGHVSNLLHDLCQWDEAIAAELVNEFLDYRDPDSPTSTTSQDSEPNSGRDLYRHDPSVFPNLVMNAWKFKLLRKYVVKGRMELRVVSIGTMDNALVDLWKEYNTSPQSVNHPVMQYLADFLLHERVVDYIISVDSHPQLISRSGNIVGFLVVTHRYSDSQTDAIWNTVSKSSDPRVVSATMTMLRGIFALMQPRDQLYLCTKLYDLPIESYNLDILRFLRELNAKLQQTYVDWTLTDLKARPWNVCIRVLQDTSPGKETPKLFTALHHEAFEQLRIVSTFVGSDERHQIYRECAMHIANRSAKATGSVRAIYVLAAAASFNEAGFFKENPDVTRQVLEETCTFIEDEQNITFNPPQALALQYRLDFLCLLICRVTEAIPTDFYQDLWDHLIGRHAQTNQLRDMAWSKFLEAVRVKPDNGFCKELINVYVPSLEPEYYTPGMFEFVASYRFPTTRRVVITEAGEKELLQIRGADLLWSMIISAPPQTIEDRAARLLAARYLELNTDPSVTLEEVESAHIALVDQCAQDLLSVYKILRNKNTPEPGNTDQMDVVPSAEAKQQNERKFTRTILFLKLLLMSIRTKPEFNRTRRSDSKVEPLDMELPYGDALEIKYQSPVTNEKQSVLIGSENTVQDLYTRICHATGFSKVNLFAKGQRLNVNEKANLKMADLDLAGHLLLVQKAPGSEVNQPIAEAHGSCSVFEAAVLNHFEELFACMDKEDPISAVLYDFLSCFPFQERIAESVISGKASADELFPPGKLFQAKYAAYALHTKLKEQTRKNSVDDTFLANAVQILDRALLNPALIEDSLSSQGDVHLAGVLVLVLMDFLRERPSPEVSATYFSDEQRLVKRLLSLLSVTLKAETDIPAIVVHCYTSILEASLHSNGVWEAFTNDDNIHALHKALLLADNRKPLREHIAKVISSICGGGLSPSSALTEANIATCFWSMISSVLPDAVRYPSQSEQLFELADQVFRKYDENNRDETSLRTYLGMWSDLLLEYRHEEFVGRDETDFVVLGFTKLLLSCVSSLKSFKKPLNAGMLVEKIWSKFLFVPRITDIDEDSNQQLPVLESKTRKELYDLVLALAEDRNSHGKLLDLAEGFGVNEADMALRAFSVDRANEIRAPTGYVGLFNPRAICYMNSLLTQLFMNVNFRKFLLGLDVGEHVVQQRLLHETQQLFARMQNSYRKSADPRDFAACVKVPEGVPIDINVQMDADEFYNLLFDQWEAQMISPETKQQFRSFYGGQTVNQIKSKECEHVSERVESFFVVQCDVLGKQNLVESLQAFVEGDVMEGDNKYKCESCGGKLVDAVKRTCLKDVPDNLIFHLKRFDFDLVELRRAKINDHFDFPTCIDVSPFKIDHLSDPSKPRQEDMFELVGVLVHQGTSENGHYYSYIRERPCPPGSLSQWVEFNDRDVDAFDHQSIPYHAFGGFYDEQFPRQQKQFSAYMLFYQRKSAIEKDHSDYIGSSQSGAVKVQVPPALDKYIRADNENLIREYSLYDPNHTKFVRQILMNLRTVNHGTCSEDHQQETQALHIVLEHLCQTLFRVRSAENFEETILQLRKTVLSCPTCCNIALKWLATQEYALVNMLLQCMHMKIRSQMRAFLIDSLRYLRDKDPAAYGTEGMDTDSDISLPVGGMLVEIAIRLRNVAEESYVAARGWDDFYLTLCQLSNMGYVETAVLLHEGFLDFCLRLFCMQAIPSLRMRDPDLWRLIEKKKRIYNRTIEFIYTLLSKMDLQLPVTQDRLTHRLEKYDRTISKFPLSREERHWLLQWHEENRALAALDRMLEFFDPTKTEVFYPGEILKWMLQSQDPRTQQQLFITVYEGVHQLSPPYADPYVRAALPYCEASPDVSYVEQVIEIVGKAAGKVRDQGGEVHIRFFMGLLKAENEIVFEERGYDFFYDFSLIMAKKISVPLLLYDDDGVRRATMNHIQELLTRHKEDDHATEDTIKYKFRAIRVLASEMCAKIAEEHQNSSPRSYMHPMIHTCNLLVQLLYLLHNSDEPRLQQFKQANDTAIIHSYEHEVAPRLRNWPMDEDTPISTGEAYEQSDYGSESDVDPDLLDM